MRKLGLALLALLLVGLIPAGCDNEPKEEETKFTLKINDLPSANELVKNVPGFITWGASLLNSDDIDHAVAIGMPGANNIFTFYYPKEGVDKPFPDATRPFYKNGEYKLGIAIAEFTGTTHRVYMYTGSNIIYKKTTKNVTIDWEYKFEEQAQ